MAYPKNKNEIYQKILELTYNFYISRKNFSNTQYTNLYLEFNNSSFDIGNTHPDPNGIFTGSAFEFILHAKFIIADLTEQRPNCYYELGFSHAHGKDVIHIIHEKEPIHFDIKDYNFIVYQSVSELKVRLKDRIINTIKKQPSNL